MTLCEENCTFVRYDFIKNKSICSCEVKIQIPLISEITIDKNRLYDSFTDINNLININVLKCYKLLFSKEGISNNIGFFISLPIILLFIIGVIIFYVYDYKKLKIKIELIIYAKKNYDRLKQINEQIDKGSLNYKKRMEKMEKIYNEIIE